MNVTFSTRTSYRSNLILPFLLWWDQSDTKWPRTADDDDDMATIAALRLLTVSLTMELHHRELGVWRTKLLVVKRFLGALLVLASIDYCDNHVRFGYEALELRNGGSDYFGKGVLKSEGIILALFAMHSHSP
ncbi:Putative 1-phosphatidylinositol-3-phosphate 5-kinase FAB1D [Zea mays]|uniref:Putative 1-phosphatidylinositol-3-phosphate 5-kinase FAB1D n=1 Tax=Zea mays TaxID=4577 RepID=A0A1D6KRI3_MAIZE|nr:Putative 1-phosphatidylinositol-3-phosphate 5-kinase FAB1D [Zea mays]